ncbi:MAG: Shikimate kinase [Myxococcota bacterium]|nr:Shikimate kinase [Myxococcota bacterium]
MILRCPVFLWGFMGAGKTTVARILARRLAVPHHDTDAMVERLAGMSIPEIFARMGEMEFRRLEREAAVSLMDQPSVVSLGGGALLDSALRARARSHGPVIVLTAPVEVLWKRASLPGNRPLAGGGLPEFAGLLHHREAAYRDADWIVPNADGSPEQTAAAILCWMEENGYAIQFGADATAGCSDQHG